MKRSLFFLFLLMTACLLSCSKGGNGESNPSLAQTAGAAPDFILKDIEGKNVQLSQYKGKVVILEFWATWCPPCKATIPGLISLQKKYADKGLVVLGVSVDEGDDLRTKLSTFSKEHKINYPVLLGSENVSRTYGVMSIPATFLIGKDQIIIGAYKGYVDDLENIISEKIDKNL